MCNHWFVFAYYNGFECSSEVRVVTYYIGFDVFLGGPLNIQI